MITPLRPAYVAAILVLCASAVSAQPPSTQPSASAPETETRPATTTFFGDTGLWFVPTGEVLPHGMWSVSGYRRGTDYDQGYTNVGDFAGTFGIGLRGRAEVFGSFLFDTRIDRDRRPLFGFGDSATGGVVDPYPGVRTGWTGNHVGDFYLGAKVNLMSEARQQQAALAVRGMVKLPTGDDESGSSTGKADGLFDLIVSKEASQRAEVSGYVGWAAYGSPSGFDRPGGAFRWGFGVGGPTRSPLRVSGELTGEVPSGDTVTTLDTLIGTDGSIAPALSDTQTLTRATAAVTYQAPRGWFVGAGVGWTLGGETRQPSQADSDPGADYWDLQVRVGFHPGAPVYVPPPPPPPPPPPSEVPNRPPTVQARCEPCTVEVGRTVRLTATAQDPDGDVLRYAWTAPAGTLQNPAVAQTIWTAPMQEGPVQVTVTVEDGKGGRASDTVTIQVVRPRPVVELTFEDVYFDFDRSTLRPAALRILDEAVTKLQANPDRNIVIEGHTCSIGTAEYNLALGERRAASVREYLISRGVPAGRLETRSYGEERPKFDNAREETRRLNRRAALVVRVQ
jgi:outer membrane protein OmpA-like peptidoglycan-associated protein